MSITGQKMPIHTQLGTAANEQQSQFTKNL